ncbi:polyketide synthase dehydratase domain-containing protein [Streptomyces sp. NBC_00091]|uniref:polyketide synthase dehydratase domain-containing protein n=1 Tax=Streptomyces sp. NBC_00091 TaxID=2975648 RepID=UPI0022558154|nr:polyketide synthase dehydratase domain-containing protein [Streptomyces sp. NBC_00091]MCX5381495.1 polyketide synthase dehydratase domain-containing protein [Streptomyces sp. NBC_00091]
MPRPPRSHWPTDTVDQAPGPTGILGAVLDQHRLVGTLHTRFLRMQGELIARLAAPHSGNTGPAATEELVADPATAPWLLDHRPSWTVPTMPLMSMADLLAGAISRHSGRAVRSLDEVQVRRWLPLPGPTRLRLSCRGEPERPTATLELWWEAADPALSRFTRVATATARFDTPARPARFAALADARTMPCPYEDARLFHGPAFQYLTSWRLGSRGASGTLLAEGGSVPAGTLPHGLLDGALHLVPHDSLWQWDPAIDRTAIAFPHRINDLTLFEPLPALGEIQVESRYAGTHRDDPRLVSVDLQMCTGETVLAAFRLTVVLIPAGPLAAVPPTRRRAYLRDRAPVPELLCSTTDGDGDTTVLHRDTIEALDTPPGTAAALYALPAGEHPRDHIARIAAKEHVARLIDTHPANVELAPDLRTAHPAGQPGHRIPLTVTSDGRTATVRTGQHGGTACQRPPSW